MPDAARLQKQEVNLLRTNEGPLDLVQTIGRGQTYEALDKASENFDFGKFQFRVASLEVLIESKRFADRPKDHRALPILEHLLQQQSE